MKRYGNLFERITDIDNLVHAHLIARKKSKKKKAREIAEVDRDVLGYCTRLRDALINHTFTTSEYRVFQICDRGKQRDIYDLPYYPDRLLHWAIMLVIKPIFQRHFISTTYAAMPGEKRYVKKFGRVVSTKGTHAAFVKLNEYIEDKEATQYCLKLDVKKYFPSIDRDILKSLLRRKIKCPDTLWLLDDIIDSHDAGVPIGSFTSQYFGNFYLSYFDHWIKEEKRVKYYIRYMDDLVILHHDKEYLHQLRKDIDEYLQTHLNIRLKENWQVFPTFVRGIDFVGYRSFGTHAYLRKSTKKQLQHATKRLRQKVNKGKPFTLSDKSKIGSYKGILGWGDCAHLTETTIKQFFGGLYGKNGKRHTGRKARRLGVRENHRLRA